MKILEVYKDIFPEVTGGIERYVHDLSLFLTESGHRVQVLVAGGGSRTVNGIPVAGVPSAGRMLSNPIAPGYGIHIARSKADVVHFHLPLPSAVIGWMTLPPGMRSPYAVTYHSDIVRQAFAMPLYGPVLRRFLRGAGAVLATSDLYRESSPYLKGLSNSVTVPIGVDISRFTPGACDVRGHYLFVGRFREYKGVFVLLEAWRHMKDPPALIMAGGGAMEQSIRNYIAEHSLPVEILVDVSDDELTALYRTARALILPSIRRSEAYGMVILEAMACGAPVISSDLPTGVSWLNQSGVTGLCFETGNHADLADKVMWMECNPSKREEMGKQAHKRASGSFQSRAMFERVEKWLKKTAES